MTKSSTAPHSPTPPPLLHALALHQEGRLDEAWEIYDTILQTDPHHFDALHLGGVLRHQQGRSAEALRLVAAALKARPESSDVLSNHGVILDALRRHEEALANFDRVLVARSGDANAHYNRGNALKNLGRLGEALASYDRALTLAPGNVDALHNRGNTFAVLGHYAQALADYDRVLVLRPQYVPVLVRRGDMLAALGRYGDALAAYGDVLKVECGNAEALNNRSVVLLQLGRHDEALECSELALAARPDYADALYNHGNVLRALSRFDDARASYEAALAIEPQRIDALNNLGLVLASLGRPVEALESYERALAIEPDNAQLHYNSALCLLAGGNFREGWRRYEWRWKSPQWDARQRGFPQPQWLGDTPVAGKTILLHAEQGYGDALQFFRYAPLVARRGAKVVVEMYAPIVPLLAGDKSITIVARGQSLPPFDLHCSLMSLPFAFGTELDTIPTEIPYLAVPPARVARWRDRLGECRRLRIGVVWAGRATPENTHRSISLTQFSRLFATPGAEFVSLQRDMTPADTETLRSHANVLDIGCELTDFADTAATIALVDMVISVDTAVAHLAGAIGKPVWILLPFAADFRWLLERTDNPWYPTARLFRQKSIGDWEEPLDEARNALKSKTAVGAIWRTKEK